MAGKMGVDDPDPWEKDKPMAIDIGEVPDDPDLAVLKLCQLWHDFRYSDRAPDLDDRSIAEFYALILVMGDTYDLNFTGPPLGNGAN